MNTRWREKVRITAKYYSHESAAPTTLRTLNPLYIHYLRIECQITLAFVCLQEMISPTGFERSLRSESS